MSKEKSCMPGKEKNDFTFMSEQLKKKPFYRKKWFLKGTGAGVLAVIFGAVAGLTFSVMQPWAQKQFGEPEDPAQIIVVQEATESEDSKPETESETASESESETAARTVIEQKSLEISDYKMLYEKMAEVAAGVEPALVTVTCETNNLDWFDEVMEDRVQSSGLVIAQSKKEYYIVTGSQAVENARRIIVSFSDGSAVESTLCRRDEETGLSVIRVEKADMSEEAKKITPEELWASSDVQKGEPVIALGTPVANSTSMSFGMVTSVTETPVVDAHYKVLSTDILGSDQGNGILIDLNGRIIGIIAQNFSTDSSQITLTALEASDIQELITTLANNQDRASVGIIGKEIDETISEEFQMPRGIYVRSVEEESPAMYAGVYETDIITSINGVSTQTIEEYEKAIQEQGPEAIVTLGIKRASIEGYADIEISVQLGRR
jgi:S1-C subfamily serine protease